MCPIYFSTSCLLGIWNKPTNCHCCTVTVELKIVLKSHQLFSSFLGIPPGYHVIEYYVSFDSFSWWQFSWSFQFSIILSGIEWTVHFWFVWWFYHDFGVESCRDNAPVSSPVCHPICITSCQGCYPGSYGQLTCFPRTVFSFFGNDPLSPADFQDYAQLPANLEFKIIVCSIKGKYLMPCWLLNILSKILRSIDLCRIMVETETYLYTPLNVFSSSDEASWILNMEHAKFIDFKTEVSSI